jgi:hypothetical protein
MMVEVSKFVSAHGETHWKPLAMRIQMDLGRLSPGKQIECPLIRATYPDVLLLCSWSPDRYETSALVVTDKLRIRCVIR